MRTVVISGASSGIGHATAERFATNGDIVFNLDNQSPGRNAHERVRWIFCDVTNWETVDHAVEEAYAERNALDVVIANAGISVRRAILDMTEADSRRVMDVNLLGVLGLWRCAARYMLPVKQGVLLATGSVNGLRGFPLYADYNASKAGIAALCRTFAIELSPYIRAACVSPGAVLTPMQEAEYTQQMLSDVESRIPAGRHAATSEIAEAFFYLASDAARYITGQELVIDGGEVAGSTTSMLARSLHGGAVCSREVTDT